MNLILINKVNNKISKLINFKLKINIKINIMSYNNKLIMENVNFAFNNKNYFNKNSRIYILIILNNNN